MIEIQRGDFEGRVLHFVKDNGGQVPISRVYHQFRNIATTNGHGTQHNIAGVIGDLLMSGDLVLLRQQIIGIPPR